MVRNSTGDSEKSRKLINENKVLQQQLLEAKEYIDLIKTKGIDALVITNKKNLKIYTEETADETYRILIEKMHEGAATLNKFGIILFCNSYFANMVKLPLQNVIGKNFKMFINLSQKQFKIFLTRSRENDIKEELYINTGDGKAMPVLMSVNTLSFKKNFLLNIIITDLTSHNKNQEEIKFRATQLEQKNIELENANKDLTSFTYVSSHDLQEPLRKIQNFVMCILSEEEKNLSENGKRYFQRIGQTAKQMQALIDDLLTYSRTKSHDRKFEKTDLNLLAEEIKNDFEETVRDMKGRIETGNLCEVSVIQFQFRQLMHNLISNSLKFSKPGRAPHITIKSKIVKGKLLHNEKLSPKISYCKITYSDNGIGFDPQYKERIFEVFQRLHSKEEYKGTGIGLAICKRIVENHNGIITASSEINKGATFYIYIPALS